MTSMTMAFMILYVISLCVYGQQRMTSAISSSQVMADRLRYTLINQDDGRSRPIQRLTAVLPDAPFIQLRSGGPLKPGAQFTGTGATSAPATTEIIRIRKYESTMLQCEVMGMPSPSAYWLKNGQPINGRQAVAVAGSAPTRGNRPITASDQLTEPRAAAPMRPPANMIEMMTNNGKPTLENAVTVAKLKLECVTERDAGLYECVGDNGVEKIISKTQVVVEDNGDNLPDGLACPKAIDNDATPDGISPNIYMYTEMRLEYPGNDAQLFCRANGAPNPTMRWVDANGIPLKASDNYTVLPSGDLLVKHINFGPLEPFRQFSCQASNVYGTDAATITLLAIAPSDK